MTEPFFLVVVDDDKKEYAVEGPTRDDSYWTTRVAEAQKAGRAVRCFAHNPDNADNLKKWEAEHKLRRVVAITDILWPESPPGYQK